MALVKLTNTLDDQAVFINPLHVAYVRDYDGEGDITEIIFAGSPSDEKLRVTVKESVHVVVQQIADEQAFLLRAA